MLFLKRKISAETLGRDFFARYLKSNDEWFGDRIPAVSPDIQRISYTQQNELWCLVVFSFEIVIDRAFPKSDKSNRATRTLTAMFATLAAESKSNPRLREAYILVNDRVLEYAQAFKSPEPHVKIGEIFAKARKEERDATTALLGTATFSEMVLHTLDWINKYKVV